MQINVYVFMTKFHPFARHNLMLTGGATVVVVAAVWGLEDHINKEHALYANNLTLEADYIAQHGGRSPAPIKAFQRQTASYTSLESAERDVLQATGLFDPASNPHLAAAAGCTALLSANNIPWPAGAVTEYTEALQATNTADSNVHYLQARQDCADPRQVPELPAMSWQHPATLKLPL